MKQDIKDITGISYFVISPKNADAYACVWLRDEIFTHRDFMFTKMKEGVKRGEFSSCGILLYDGERDKWFPIFTSYYKKNMSPQEKSKNLLLAYRETERVYGQDVDLKRHLFEIAVKLIAEQEATLKKVGLSEQKITEIVERTKRQREEYDGY